MSKRIYGWSALCVAIAFIARLSGPWFALFGEDTFSSQVQAYLFFAGQQFVETVGDLAVALAAVLFGLACFSEKFVRKNSTIGETGNDCVKSVSS